MTLEVEISICELLASFFFFTLIKLNIIPAALYCPGSPCVTISSSDTSRQKHKTSGIVLWGLTPGHWLWILQVLLVWGGTSMDQTCFCPSHR